MHKIISSRKNCGVFSSTFKIIIPNNTTPTFQEVGGVAQPLIFCRWHKIFSWYRINHHQIDWFLLSKYFYFFVCPTVFIWNEPERQLIAKHILWPIGKF